ncbi:MAG: hypothetical protein MSS60_10345 [Clostridiales bacterium]|nr:hypothetical protein [Clostridiales bacterium]
MMRKNVSRLLALVLVLCMVVLCVPVRAYAEDVTRPEGYTDEEWQEYLRKKKLLEAADESVAVDTGTTITSSTTNAAGEETPAFPPAASKIPEQSVTVDVPVDESATVEDNKAITEETVAVTPDETVEATIKEKYEVEADIEKVEITDGEITDITYDVSLDKTTTVTDEDGEKISETTVPDIDVEENKNAADTGAPAPQYNVNLSANGMKAENITRVEHKYTKKVTTEDGTEETVEETEYYYNAANGVDEQDTGKKYFTVSEVEKETETSGVVSKMTEKVVSLWTSFLGIFHITTDAFEGSEKADGTKDTYANLSAAVDANAGQTVEMMRDYETDSTASLDKNVTVDLNGHTYTNTGAGAAMTASGDNVAVENGEIYSGGDGINVTGGKFSLRDIFLKSNAKDTNTGVTAGIQAGSGASGVTVENSGIDGSNSRYGILYSGSSSAANSLKLKNSSVVGGTGVAVDNANASISGSYVEGIGKAVKGTNSGAAVAASGKSKVEITSGLFDSARAVDNIYVADKNASVSISGGRFTDPDHLYDYLPRNRAVISHNDDSYFLYEVVGTDYTPSRDGYRFLGYTDGNGNAITLAEAARRGVIAYAQWREIPEKIASALTVNDLIKVKTDEKGCTTKVTVKGDTAYVTVKDADGEFAPISEVKVISVKKLQLLKIDTIEIQVDEDVALVLDIGKAKENGFADTIEVTLEKDTLLITSGTDTCIELDIAVLKASDKPVEIQLVEGELTIMLGKSSSLSVDLSKALKTGERIVVKLENGVLKLYDKYNKPIEEN